VSISPTFSEQLFCTKFWVFLFVRKEDVAKAAHKRVGEIDHCGSLLLKDIYGIKWL
jgi:hypothetical protein